MAFWCTRKRYLNFDYLGTIDSNGASTENTLERILVSTIIANHYFCIIAPGATATMKLTGLALANNTLMLPRRESQEDEEEEDMTR